MPLNPWLVCPEHEVFQSLLATAMHRAAQQAGCSAMTGGAALASVQAGEWPGWYTWSQVWSLLHTKKAANTSGFRGHAGDIGSFGRNPTITRPGAEFRPQHQYYTIFSCMCKEPIFRAIDEIRQQPSPQPSTLRLPPRHPTSRLSSKAHAVRHGYLPLSKDEPPIWTTKHRKGHERREMFSCISRSFTPFVFQTALYDHSPDGKKLAW